MVGVGVHHGQFGERWLGGGNAERLDGGGIKIEGILEMVLCLGKDGKRWEVWQTLHGSQASEVQEWVELLWCRRRNLGCLEAGEWFDETHMWSWWQVLFWRLEGGYSSEEVWLLMINGIFLGGSLYFEGG